MATFYKVGEGPIEVQPANGEAFTLEELHDFVNGYIEIIQLIPPDSLKPNPLTPSMVINEEGKYQGDCTYNRLATNIFRSHFTTEDWIAGNALVASNKELGE